MRSRLLLIFLLIVLGVWRSAAQSGEEQSKPESAVESSEKQDEPKSVAQGEAEGAEKQSEPESEVEKVEVPKGGFPVMDYSIPKKYIVNDIRVHGVEFLDVNSLIAVSGLKKGDEVFIPGDYVSKAIKNFWNKRYFSDVEVSALIVGDSVNFDIFLQERPIVYRWKFEGVKKGQETDIKEKLALKPGTELSDFVINKYKNQIVEFYTEKGFRNAEVDVAIENDTMYNNAVNVTFLVDKKSRVKVGEIKFSGNEVFKSKRLARTFKKTKKKDINIFKSSKLDEKEFINDKELLIEFYNSKGYRNAVILADSVYKINDKRIGIGLDVDEGNKYFYRDVDWVGNSVYETEFLDRMLGIQRGDTYDKKSMHKRLGIGREANPDDMSVTSLYQNDGYLFFSIEPAEIIVGEDSINLQVKMTEGKQATINEVKITGNTRVNDEVVRRELYTRPGDLYNRSLLMTTMRQIAQMQHFNPEVMPGVQPVTSELVDISWDLEEQASDQAEISGGWGAGMFVGSIGLTLNNVSLKNFFKKGAWRPYPHGQNQQLRIRAQSNGSYYKAVSLGFTEPWLGGRKPNSLSVSFQYSDETDAMYMWQAGSSHFRTIGASVGLGQRLSWPDPNFTLYMEVSYQRYNLKDWDYFLISNGNSNIFSFTTVFARNTVDQPIYPREGSEFSVSLTLTPPYSLIDGVDYGDSSLPDEQRYKWIEYHKWKVKAEWFVPLSRNKNLVLMARAQLGYIGHYNKNKLSPFEGFEVGGDGMSGYNLYGVDVVGLRGYENGSVTPKSGSKNDYAKVYNKFTLELRYPFILKPSSTIYGVVFAEGGNAFTGWDKFNPLQIKRSLGAGVRVYLPIVGMLGVDWAYGFDKAVGGTKASGSQIHYMIGMQF